MKYSVLLRLSLIITMLACANVTHCLDHAQAEVAEQVGMPSQGPIGQHSGPYASIDEFAERFEERCMQECINPLGKVVCPQSEREVVCFSVGGVAGTLAYCLISLML